ncbi:unnamed protein product [Diabrotica balteata]|uniref:Kinesin motor domain-containing protein n=1 Tax=Diabrotica balteata TaxID=107213 RepID=A0A9N9SRN5_DIABA|nr:unnamed protein product [Diabrotica balteata]
MLGILSKNVRLSVPGALVKVMLRVSNPTPPGPGVDGGSYNGFFSIDKRKKQVTLTDPSICNGSAAPEDRRVGVAAPKMFAFDAIFSQDDSQTEVCSSALTDVVHAVINGTDGCLFCFGQAGLDSEQSPGMYLRDEHLFGNQPPHCELRVPSAERAAHYLDAAIECRSCHKEDSRDSHFLFTLHVYQYSVAGKGGVAGGRSRLHLIDLGNSDRSKSSGGIPLSGVGNIILAIFNGQKHLPYKEHKLTQLLKECLGCVTCHATMIAHVSPLAQNYLDTLTTVQLASRIHRMRRKRIKFVSTAAGNGSGGSIAEQRPSPSKSSKSEERNNQQRNVAEAFHLMKEKCHVRKRETWIDGPMKEDTSCSYGYMDSHKKNMIRKWVEHQTIQIQKSRHVIPKATTVKLKETPKEVPQIQPSEQTENLPEVNNSRKQDSTEDSSISRKPPSVEEDLEDEEEPEIPPPLPLIQPLSSREVSLESLDQILKDRMISNAEYNNYQKFAFEDLNTQDEVLEIIEVEEPLEPVPMQDSCLQVTEEDIALCMGYVENPLPEVDQENPLDHPLRILSQENLTVVSTFTDSLSAFSDLDRILPRYHLDMNGYYNDYEDVDNPTLHNNMTDDPSMTKLNQLTRLHELYSNELSKAKVCNPRSSTKDKMSRCESLTLADMLFGSEKERNDDGSIYSEPVYVQDKFCENCKINMYNHDERDTLSNLRHPDGASNPNLEQELSTRLSSSVLPEFITAQPTPPPNSLPSVERINRAILNLETGIAAIKMSRKLGDGGQKSEEYDSGHDSTPRTSKHSPAGISRRAESGYDSIVRDSENSSIDSEHSRIFHSRRGKCKHKHDKSFCSWFLMPFTCKYIDEPPETHF